VSAFLPRLEEVHEVSTSARCSGGRLLNFSISASSVRAFMAGPQAVCSKCRTKCRDIGDSAPFEAHDVSWQSHAYGGRADSIYNYFKDHALKRQIRCMDNHTVLLKHRYLAAAAILGK
jgi:hypothetical protein